MEEQKIILVTGGNGLVGHGIRLALEKRKLAMPNEKWIYVSSKDADLRDFQQTRAMFERYRPTHVVHLAAMVGGLFHHEKQNCDFLRNNLLINLSVLENCHQMKVQKVVSCLSTCIFPDKTSLPIDESMVHLGPPHYSNFGYSYAKRLVDVQSRAYRLQYGDNFTTVVPTNIFGPHDNFDITNGHVLPALIHKAYRAKYMKENGGTLEVFGTGKAQRQFIYSLDLGELIIEILRRYDDPEPIILSVGQDEERTIYDAAVTIARTMGIDPNTQISFNTTKSDGQCKKTVDISKLRKFVPNYKFTPFEAAMRETVDWFKIHYEDSRKSG